MMPLDLPNDTSSPNADIISSIFYAPWPQQLKQATPADNKVQIIMQLTCRG